MRESRYLTIEDRKIIEKLSRKGMNQKEIADVLEVSQSTISRELRKGLYLHTRDYRDIQRYSYSKAQDITDKRYRNKGRECKFSALDCEFSDILDNLIVECHFSPYAALMVVSRQLGYQPFSLSSLYNYIYAGKLTKVTLFHLLEKVSRRHRKTILPHTRAHMNHPGKKIDIRPDIVDNRTELGHWEFDLVIGNKAGKGEVLLTSTERISKYEIITKLPDKTSASVVAALDQLGRRYDFRRTFKTITVDNGVEFRDYKGMERKGKVKRTDVYYAHPYSSWERPFNERMNRMCRRFFPKGTSLASYTQADCDAAADYLNNYPRRSLGGYTPKDVLEDFLSDKTKKICVNT